MSIKLSIAEDNKETDQDNNQTINLIIASKNATDVDTTGANLLNLFFSILTILKY